MACLWRKPREERQCKVCNKTFTCRKDSDQKFCSIECYRLFQKSGDYFILKNRKGSDISCLICSNNFYVVSSKQKFCSRKCYLVFHSRNMKNKTCPICGKTFYANKIHRFCSNNCYLKDHRQKLVNKTCPVCQERFLISLKGKETKKCCSVKCAKILIGASKSRKDKISKTLKEQYKTGKRIAWSLGKTKDTNLIVKKMAETRAGQAAWNKGVPMLSDEKEKHSKRISQLYIEGKMNYHGEYFYSKKNQKSLFYRSSYELLAFTILEQMSIVKNFQSEPFRIPYIDSEGLQKNTIPDLFVIYNDGTKELIEVKPNFKLKWENERLKLEVMKNYALENNIKFSIWSEEQLGLN